MTTTARALRRLVLAGVVAAGVAAAGCDTGEDGGNTDASGMAGASAGGSGGGAGTGAAGTGVAGTGVAGGSAAGRGGVTGNAGTGGGAAGAGGSDDGGVSGTGGSSDGGIAGTGGGQAGASGRGGAAGAGGRGGAAGATAGGGGGAAGRGGAAGGVAGSGGGTGGAVAFNPCPTNGTACNVLPFGDSITDGIGSPSPGGGYRVDLFSRAVMAGKKLTFVGQSMNGPTTVAGMTFPRRHAGFSGYTIAQITAANIFDPAIGMGPHIVLLHIGTNDMNMNPSGASQRLETLIDKLTTMAPNALIVVAKIIPLPGNGSITAYNNAIGPIVQARIAAGKHVVLVDQFAGFPTSELPDNIHPNAAGYVRMAGVWYAAISGLLP